MKRNRLVFVLGFLIAFAPAKAAIPLNSLQTFDSAPLVADWATRSAGGGGGSILLPQDLDAAVQTNEVSAITNALPLTVSGDISTLAQWNSSSRCIQTRPTSVAFSVLLATLYNTSGRDLNLVTIAYDLGNPAPAPDAEDPGLGGHRAYSSLTGQPGSWSLIPELSTAQPGSLVAILWLGAWPAGAPLYLLWADDNGSVRIDSPATDSAFTIDNFIAMESLPPPPPPHVDPAATNIVCGDTIRLAAVVFGFGLSFQWFKDGQVIDAGLNPTAIQPVLIITNSYPSDAGQYRVVVQNAAGGMISDAVPVQVGCGDPPRFVFAYNMPDDPKGIRVSVDEPLCTDFSLCGGDATFVYSWIIESVPSFIERVVDFVEVNGTDLQFTLAEPRVQGETYRIRPADLGTGQSAISDPFGNRMLLGDSITSAPALLFKQRFNSYSGTQDTEIHSDGPADTPLGGATSIRVDLDAAGIAQGLLRFDNLFGNGAGQLPPGTRILRATLDLAQVDAGSTVLMHRMLIPWDQASATWNSFVGGIATDDVEARIDWDATIPSGVTDPIDVTASVQSWSDGQSNHGWLLQSTGTDGFTLASSESAQPPALMVIPDLRVVEPPCVLTSAQLPPALNLLEGQSFVLSPLISLSGFCLPTFQWMKNGENIQGAQGSSFTIPTASVCDAGSYQVIVSLAGQSVTSNPTIVMISADIVRPVLTRASGSPDGTNITLTFSKVMNATNAPDPAHYVLDPPLTVTSAALSPDGRTVTLTTAPRTPLTPYTLHIQDVTDNRGACPGSIGNVISPNPTVVQLTGVRVDVPWDSEWLYSTNNQDATLATPAPWYAPNFSPGPDWLTGQALFGTEPSAGTMAQFPTPLLTSIPPNTNTPPDQITTYFRKQIDLLPLPPGATYALCHFIDDGAAFYLDGAEIGRVNLGDETPLLFAQRATTSVEASLQCLPFDATSGAHLLAVEVHQAGTVGSPDILFGVQVETIASTPRLDIGENQPLLSWSADSSWGLVSSTNAAGPYAPVTVNTSLPLGSYYSFPTNPASFFRLRYKGAVK